MMVNIFCYNIIWKKFNNATPGPNHFSPIKIMCARVFVYTGVCVFVCVCVCVCMWLCVCVIYLADPGIDQLTSKILVVTEISARFKVVINNDDKINFWHTLIHRRLVQIYIQIHVQLFDKILSHTVTSYQEFLFNTTNLHK